MSKCLLLPWKARSYLEFGLKSINCLDNLKRMTDENHERIVYFFLVIFVCFFFIQRTTKGNPIHTDCYQLYWIHSDLLILPNDTETA